MSVVGRASTQQPTAAMCRLQLPNESDVIVDDLVSTGHNSRDRTCFRPLEETGDLGQDRVERIASKFWSSSSSRESASHDVENLNRTRLPLGENSLGSRADIGPCMQKERKHITLGWRFNAVDAFEARPMKALTAFFSSSGAPPRKALRIRSFVRTCLILVDLRSISRRNFLRGSASGCHSPPPFPCQRNQLTDVMLQARIDKDEEPGTCVQERFAQTDDEMTPNKDTTHPRSYLHSAVFERNKQHTGLCDPFLTMPPRSRSVSALA
jgi:hypothetical protein